LEKFLLDYFGVSSLREHYISTTLLSVIVFIFFTGNIWDGKLKSLKYIGERLSLYIYIIHPIVLFFLGVCIGRMPQVVKDIYTAVMPIMIFGASVIASDLFYRIKKQVRT
jgi:surface polysaccharide O-acyltransferase-like enzyme